MAADDRGSEATAALFINARPGGLELSRLSSTLSAGAQRARLLVSGVAGPLSDRQRALALDLLRDLEQLCDAAGAAAASLKVEPRPFDLATQLRDVVGSFRFLANRRQLTMTLTGVHQAAECVADPDVVRTTLIDGIGLAVSAAPSGGRVLVELARSADRLAVDISAPGWDPRLPPAPAAGSGAALSVLRTASGARLVLSVPSAI